MNVLSDYVEVLILAIVFTIVGSWLGNREGDQATLRDCATKGTAKMAGGGSIKCDVLKVQP